MSTTNFLYTTKKLVTKDLLGIFKKDELQEKLKRKLKHPCNYKGTP